MDASSHACTNPYRVTYVPTSRLSPANASILHHPGMTFLHTRWSISIHVRSLGTYHFPWRWSGGCSSMS